MPLTHCELYGTWTRFGFYFFWFAYNQHCCWFSLCTLDLSFRFSRANSPTSSPLPCFALPFVAGHLLATAWLIKIVWPLFCLRLFAACPTLPHCLLLCAVLFVVNSSPLARNLTHPNSSELSSTQINSVSSLDRKISMWLFMIYFAYRLIEFIVIQTTFSLLASLWLKWNNFWYWFMYM